MFALPEPTGVRKKRGGNNKKKKKKKKKGKGGKREGQSDVGPRLTGASANTADELGEKAQRNLGGRKRQRQPERQAGTYYPDASKMTKMKSRYVVDANKRMAVFANRKKLREATDIFRELQSNGLANEYSYAIIINVTAKCGDIPSVERLYLQMIDAQACSIQAVTATLRGYVEAAMFSQALQTINNISELSPSVAVNIRTCNTFFRGCLMHGEVDRAHRMFQELRKRWGLLPDSSAIEYVTTLLLQGLRIGEADALLKSARGTSACTNASILLCFSKAAGLLGETAACRRYLGEAEAQVRTDEAGRPETIVRELATERDCVPVEAEVERDSVKRDSKGLSQVRPAVMGGRRAWGASDANRRRAAKLFSAHRSGEIKLEICLVRQWLENHGAQKNADKNRSSGSRTNAVQSLVAQNRLFSFPCNYHGKEAGTKYSDALVQRLLASYGFDKCLSETEVDRLFMRMRAIVGDDGKLALRSIFSSSVSCAGSPQPNCGHENMRLEICSGAGEWAVEQAMRNEALWFSLELRHSRVHQTFCRGIFKNARNLCVLGGDARGVLDKHIAPNSFHSVHINHPEPPQQTGGRDRTSQARHLLTAPFLEAIHKVLRHGGSLWVVSDNKWYAELICRELGQTSFFSMTPEQTGLAVSGRQGRMMIYKGTPRMPGEISGGNSSSYFDRLFQSGLSTHASSHQRWTIAACKGPQAQWIQQTQQKERKGKRKWKREKTRSSSSRKKSKAKAS